jgi:hypothetical protein
MQEPIPTYTLYFSVKYAENGSVESYRCNVELPLKAARVLWDALSTCINIRLSQARP